MNHPYTAKYIAELLAEHKKHVNVGNRLYAEAPVYDFAEIIEQQMAHIKDLEEALQFYAEPDCWEHDEQGVFFMAGVFEGPTMIEADKGDLARKALDGGAA